MIFRIEKATYFRGGVVGSILLLAASCSEFYSPSQFQADESGVTIVTLDADAVAIANALPYDARRLPEEFHHVAGTGTQSPISVGGLPDPVVEQQVRPSIIRATLPEPEQPRPYILGVGDVVLVSAPQRLAASVEAVGGLIAAQNSRQGYTVQDDGAIVIPDVGRIAIGGLSLEEAEDAVFRGLVEAGIEPSFSLEVAEFNSQRVAVGGEVSRPGFVPITLQPLYLDQVIAASGGTRIDDPSFGVVRIFRNGSLYQIPIAELFGEGGIVRVLMRDGDYVFVDSTYDLNLARAYFSEQIQIRQANQSLRAAALSELQSEINRQQTILAQERRNFEARLALGAEERDYAYVLGRVARPSRFALPYENSAVLADALMDSGGVVAGMGNPGQIYVIRSGTEVGSILAYHLDASNPANFVLAVQMELRPGDVVYVAENRITSWNRVISQLLPTISFYNAVAPE